MQEDQTKKSPFAARMSRVEESATLAMAQKAAELQAQGIRVISLSLGEPDFNTPESIKAAAIKAIQDNFSHYTPVAGLMSLRKAICEKFLRDNHLHFTPEQVVVTTGAKQALYNLFQVLVDEGDEVILPAPYWVSYQAWAQMCGATLRVLPTGIAQHFKITPEQLEAAITPKTKFFIFNSPSNPTGAVYHQEEILALARVLEKYPHIWIVSDEIYEYMHFADAPYYSIAQIAALKERVLLVHGVSKNYAMTGYRIGCSITPIAIAKACTALQSQISSNACAIAQKAAEAAFLSAPQIAEDMREAFKKRRDLLLSLLREIPYLEIDEPQGAFYIFPKISAFLGKTYKDPQKKNSVSINTSKDLALFLLDQAHVATVDGEAFGAPEYLRLSYTTSEADLYEAVTKIKIALALL